MSQDENIIKDLNNNGQRKPHTVFFFFFQIGMDLLIRYKIKCYFMMKYQRYIRAYTPNISNVPDEKRRLNSDLDRPSFNFSIITEMQIESDNYSSRHGNNDKFSDKNSIKICSW
ncbi:transposon polyprotein (fragment), putative [Candida dubliniensis CD36]|uniref:Transposon polyprotein, putative n=1 Tax=Candida dubliniensis (strain CD36 / ATCC MYA-646 / CBS 7987 / NCPF 3949 / NRRL Y-17841) TaxID=573826 RepID=B9W8F6_CANDC